MKALGHGTSLAAVLAVALDLQLATVAVLAVAADVARTLNHPPAGAAAVIAV